MKPLFPPKRLDICCDKAYFWHFNPNPSWIDEKYQNHGIVLGDNHYGADKYPKRLGPSDFLMHDKYIFVYQDVRGRYMSEGTFDNMRPQIADRYVSKENRHRRKYRHLRHH